MSSDAIFDLIERVAASSGKNDKIALLEGNRDDADLKRALEYAYSPFKTYGIRKRPETIGANVGHEFDNGTWELLDDLIHRRLTGNSAIEAVQGEMTALSAKSAELFWRIVTKDMRAGFSESTCNKVWKGLIPDFPYMRCSLPKDAKLNEFDWKLGVISQEKADGMFANLDYEPSGIVRITSRQGSPFPMEAFELLEKEVKARLSDGLQYHGELLVTRDGAILPREIGNGILNSVLSGGSFAPNERPLYMIWDAIPLLSVVTKGKYEVPYIKRLATINRTLKLTTGEYVALIETRVYHSLSDAYGHYRDLLKKGKEGTIIKNPHAIWKDGTSKEQVKLKLEFEVELEVYGFEEGNGKNADTFGALKCKSSCGQLLVSVSGFTDAKRREIHENRDDWGSGAVITVRANSIMRPSESSEFHSLFLPRFVERRLDKTSADDLARIEAQQQAAMEAA